MLGAVPSRQGTAFRVWSPKSRRVDVMAGDGRTLVLSLARGKGGYFHGRAPRIRAGDLYLLRLDGNKVYADPCSRFQPEGPFGPSMVIDPEAYRWHDAGWKGLSLRGQVLYELHIGTFTPQGTFASARRRLVALRALGVTAVELMPVNEFSGRWNWGYDGVAIYAPSRNYGCPDDLRRFVDTAHSLGIGVVLDVVYNHMGAEGCFLRRFSDSYFSSLRTDWGNALNFDGPQSAGVRDFFTGNAVSWIREYHLDGLRVDATQDIHDRSPCHILSDITDAGRKAAGARGVLFFAENEPQDTRCLAGSGDGGLGFDAMWADDFHHSVRVAATGFREAYFQDYRGSPQELLSAAKKGFLFQGQYYFWQGKKRGTPVTREPGASFVVYLQNHDQIANHPEAGRIADLISPGLYRALMTFMMLSPCTPLLFMGQEWGETAPFPFFADIPRLAEKIYEGRKAFIAQFPTYARPGKLGLIPHPCDASTFRRAHIGPGLRGKAILRFHRRIIGLRKKDPVVARQSRDSLQGAVLGPSSFVIRYDGGAQGDRLLMVNYGGSGLRYVPLSEPLLAPGRRTVWRLVFSSDDRCFGGQGRVHPLGLKDVCVPAETAFFFRQVRQK